mmetsp:Transcript_1073/g.2025  ORF Transcript_1073/g.2025 Transcript_1073/m.2025 type:complete len:216 (-) Transcript_1073:230-877(-)|eukprot:CAMPEP_0170200352 /NCGR_PEP_ID=MMETSP0040_2-20121228/69824_1 /TAXON_ID=641309 /ORGANISM="Lotharella oceanica, Strain CCMP622" /LENGTH=215 /DNA_ID=CAMNT_0010450531 /DNA_START=424 /DNA_END=1071 /DNA_ORIENTATION=-
MAVLNNEKSLGHATMNSRAFLIIITFLGIFTFITYAITQYFDDPRIHVPFHFSMALLALLFVPGITVYGLRLSKMVQKQLAENKFSSRLKLFSISLSGWFALNFIIHLGYGLSDATGHEPTTQEEDFYGFVNFVKDSGFAISAMLFYRPSVNQKCSPTRSPSSVCSDNNSGIRFSSISDFVRWRERGNSQKKVALLESVLEKKSNNNNDDVEVMS